MAETKRKGTKNVLAKLEKSVADGDYYEAQQMYKTLYFRYLGQEKYEDVKELLLSGATTMLAHSHFHEGTELALLLLNVYNQTKTPVTQQTLDGLIKLFKLYDSTHPVSSKASGEADTTSSNSSSNNNSNAKDAKETLMKSAIRWSASYGPNKHGSPELHDLFAQSYHAEGDYGKAQRHFLRGSNPQLFAKVLIEWSQQAYKSERDLFVARAVLQYLCLKNLKDANIVYDTFLELNKESNDPLPQTPLLNYLRFLLLTLQRDAYPLFDVLRKKYKLSLDRDPQFHQFVDVIAEVFYNVKASNSNNFLGDLIKSFLGPAPSTQANKK